MKKSVVDFFVCQLAATAIVLPYKSMKLYGLKYAVPTSSRSLAATATVLPFKSLKLYGHFLSVIKVCF